MSEYDHAKDEAAINADFPNGVIWGEGMPAQLWLLYHDGQQLACYLTRETAEHYAEHTFKLGSDYTVRNVMRSIEDTHE